MGKKWVVEIEERERATFFRIFEVNNESNEEYDFHLLYVAEEEKRFHA